MLITCPECELQVSDKALSCPHCGYPMQQDVPVIRKPRSKPNRRRRLPNGFGSISEIKNNRLRKPFRAVVPVGKNLMVILFINSSNQSPIFLPIMKHTKL